MNEAAILAALRTKYNNAIRVMGMTINTLTNDATPIWTGALRDAKSIRSNGWDDVDVVSGGPDVAKYIGVQYGLIDGEETPLRHQGSPKMYESLADGGADGKGGGQAAQYSRQYRKKVKEGSLQKSTPKWYRRFIEDPESVDQALTVFAQRFRK